MFSVAESLPFYLNNYKKGDMNIALKDSLKRSQPESTRKIKEKGDGLHSINQNDEIHTRCYVWRPLSVPCQ